MDRLKTKLQVKSFITKKIINEINRKIGASCLLEKKNEWSLPGFPGSINAGTNLLAAQYSRPPEESEAGSGPDPLLSLSPTQPAPQTVSVQNRKEVMPSKLSLASQQLSDKAWKWSTLLNLPAALAGYKFPWLNTLSKGSLWTNLGVQGTNAGVQAFSGGPSKDAVISALVAAPMATLRATTAPPGKGKIKTLGQLMTPVHTRKGEQQSAMPLSKTMVSYEKPHPSGGMSTPETVFVATHPSNVERLRSQLPGNQSKRHEMERNLFNWLKSKGYQVSPNSAPEGHGGAVVLQPMSLPKGPGKIDQAADLGAQTTAMQPSLPMQAISGALRFLGGDLRQRLQPIRATVHKMPKTEGDRIISTDPADPTYGTRYPNTGVRSNNQNINFGDPQTTIQVGGLFGLEKADKIARISAAVGAASFANANLGRTVDDQGNIISNFWSKMTGLPVDFKYVMPADAAAPDVERFPTRIIPAKTTAIPAMHIFSSPNDLADSYKTLYGGLSANEGVFQRITTDRKDAAKFFDPTDTTFHYQ